MKKILFVIFLNIILIQVVLPQYCVTNNLYFDRQSQIDSFPINYPGCRWISGGIFISGFSNSDITNLNGFKQLSTIGGFLIIRINFPLVNLHGFDSLKIVLGDLEVSAPLLQDFEGLDSLSFVGGRTELYNNGVINFKGLNNLRTIAGEFRVFTNPNLINLDGLSNLSTVIGQIQITDNLSLRSLEGLDSLRSVADFFISGNKALTSLRGLENLQSTGYFQIDNSALKNFGELKNLTNVQGGIIIAQNPSLKNLNGLEKLNYISGYGFDIEDNSSLENITALSNLNSVGNGIIFINNNDSLNSLSGLDNIDTASIGNLIIQNSDMLSGCAVKSICGYLANGERATISGNAAGCSSISEINAACLSLPVQLLSFSTSKITDGVTLDWQTAHENNSDYFAVERSETNILNFKQLVIVKSKGFSSQIQSYSYIDRTPPRGTNFYRLKLVDKDGNLSYSQIVSVTINNSSTLLLYPNPAKDPSILAVIDTKGKMCATKTVDATNNKLNIGGLPKGSYFLRIVSNDNVQSLKFIKE
jgi:hypothetical protein